MKTVAIVGAGISGLSAAYRLSRSESFHNHAFEIHVYDAAPRFGGVIETERRDGFLMEKGPESFLTTKPWAVDLCRELGLSGELIGTNERARQSYILLDGRLVPIPQGFYLMAPARPMELLRTPLLTWRGKLRAACEWFVPRNAGGRDESVAGFVSRRFGREIYERLARPLVSGIYAAEPEMLSLDATFPHFKKMEMDYGSVSRALFVKRDAPTRGASGARHGLFATLRGGMTRFVETLIGRMPQVAFHAEHKLAGLHRGARWKLVFDNGSGAEADEVCLALPAAAAARALRLTDPALAGELRGIPYGASSTVNLAFRRADLRPVSGAGYVVAGVSAAAGVKGCTFSSQKFEDRTRDADAVLMRAFLGGKPLAAAGSLSDEQLGRLACDEIRETLRISGEPLAVSVARFDESLPEYRIGHVERVNRINDRIRSIPGLHLAGNAYGGIGVPDCIGGGFDAADRILRRVAAIG